MSGSLYDYIELTGVIVPDTATLLADIQSEWVGVFGTHMRLSSSTPQGLMIAGEEAARQSVVQNNATLANQINPNEAGGTFLDAICALSGLERLADTYTTVPDVLIAGVAGSPIPAGSVARTPAGDEFELVSNVTLDGAGNATGQYIALTSGPVPGFVGAWTIVTDVLGLETITATVLGTTGTAQQSDQSLRALRRVTLSLQGVALIDATSSAINDITGVLSSQKLENVASTTQVIQGVTLVAHSIWVCVDGGADLDIATELLANKSMGANWNGAETLNLIGSNGQVYITKWDRPTLVPLLVRVTCAQGSFIGDVNTSVVDAVLAFANNEIENLLGFVLGQSASPFEVAAGIMQSCQGLYVRKVELSILSPVDYQPVEIAMAIFEKATVNSGDISVVIV